MSAPSNRWKIACLGVWPVEPASPRYALLEHEKAVGTPHTADAAYDNVGHVSTHVFRNMQRRLDGEPLPEADVIVPLPA